MNGTKIITDQGVKLKVSCATTFCGGWTGAIIPDVETPAST